MEDSTTSEIDNTDIISSVDGGAQVSSTKILDYSIRISAKCS